MPRVESDALSTLYIYVYLHFFGVEDVGLIAPAFLTASNRQLRSISRGSLTSVLSIRMVRRHSFRVVPSVVVCVVVAFCKPKENISAGLLLVRMEASKIGGSR